MQQTPIQRTTIHNGRAFTTTKLICERIFELSATLGRQPKRRAGWVGGATFLLFECRYYVVDTARREGLKTQPGPKYNGGQNTTRAKIQPGENNNRTQNTTVAEKQRGRWAARPEGTEGRALAPTFALVLEMGWPKE